MTISPSRFGERHRVLYVMHVDWDVLRQRPQALTEELSRLPDFDVLVAYLPNWRRTNLTANPSPVRRLPIPRLPFMRFRAVRLLNQLLGRTFLWVVARSWRPNATIVTSGVLGAYLPTALLRRGPLFYDCMDLAVGFARTDAQRVSLSAQEQALLAQIGGLFASSLFIIEALRALVPSSAPLVLVRNGYDGNLSPAPPPVAVQSSVMLRLGYIGAVSHWFDAALVRGALAADAALEFHAWGPIDNSPEPHERLFLHGPVEHDRLAEVSARVDAFVMPFKVNDLIRAVDPIKLYEYLALGRPVISVYYPELDQFAGLIQFYRTEVEFMQFLTDLRAGSRNLLPDATDLAAFLASSTWRSRALVMGDALRSALGGAGTATRP